MTSQRYRYAHQQERKRLRVDVEAGLAYCAEPVCLMADRWIPPGTPWDVSHDPSGTVTIGPSHRACNRSEGARRGNRMRRGDRQNGTANRWRL